MEYFINCSNFEPNDVLSMHSQSFVSTKDNTIYNPSIVISVGSEKFVFQLIDTDNLSISPNINLKGNCKSSTAFAFNFIFSKDNVPLHNAKDNLLGSKPSM